MQPRDVLKPPSAASTAPSLVLGANGPIQNAKWRLLCSQKSINDFAAWHAYNLISALTDNQNSYMNSLRQYGIGVIEYGGYLLYSPDDFAPSIPGTIDFIITSDPDLYNWPGFEYGKEWAGYHTVEDDGISPYAVVPWTGEGMGNFNALDTFTQVLTHELAETLLDPIPGTGWHFADGNESDDIKPCVWNPVTMGPYNNWLYAVARHWDNRTGACFNV